MFEGNGMMAASYRNSHDEYRYSTSLKEECGKRWLRCSGSCRPVAAGTELQKP
jgi:hypothetical protein